MSRVIDLTFVANTGVNTSIPSETAGYPRNRRVSAPRRNAGGLASRRVMRQAALRVKRARKGR